MTAAPVILRRYQQATVAELRAPYAELEEHPRTITQARAVARAHCYKAGWARRFLRERKARHVAAGSRLNS
jgi:hypothetical protein